MYSASFTGYPSNTSAYITTRREGGYKLWKIWHQSARKRLADPFTAWTPNQSKFFFFLSLCFFFSSCFVITIIVVWVTVHTQQTDGGYTIIGYTIILITQVCTLCYVILENSIPWYTDPLFGLSISGFFDPPVSQIILLCIAYTSKLTSLVEC